MSPGPFNATSKSETNLEGRFSSARKMWESRGSDCLNTSINNNITFAGSFNATPKSERSVETNAKETVKENKSNEPKSKIVFKDDHEDKQVIFMENEEIKRSPSHTNTFYRTESFFPEAESL